MGLGLDSLTGTLSGLGLIPPDMLQSAMDTSALQQKVTEATQAAGQAGQQYQQAAAQPVPGLDPTQTALPTLVANLASVIGGNPAYEQQNVQALAGKQSRLLQARSDNLQSLRDIYDQKARAAERAGDIQIAGEMRLKQEQINKTLGLVLQQQKDTAAQTKAETIVGGGVKRAEIGAASREKVGAGHDVARVQAAQIGATGGGGAGGVKLSDYTDTSQSGAQYFNQDAVPNKKLAQNLTTQARQAGIAVLDKQGKRALDLVTEARSNLDSIRGAAQQILAVSPGSPQRIGNALGAIFKTNPELGSYQAFRTAAINSIQAIAGLGPGLRINQAEIRAAMQNDIPTVTDPLDTGMAKLDKLAVMLNHVEQAVTAPRGAGGPQPAAAGNPAPATAPRSTAAPAVRIRVLSPKGAIFDIAPADLKDAIAHGWKRAPL